MGDAIRTVFSKYATFAGRAPRPEFWWWVLFVFIVMLITQSIDEFVFGPAVVSSQIMDDPGQPLSFIVALALILPNLAVGVRRLHDTGRSGWWILIHLIPFIGTLIFIYFAVQPSEDGVNQYG